MVLFWCKNFNSYPENLRTQQETWKAIRKHDLYLIFFANIWVVLGFKSLFQIPDFTILCLYRRAKILGIIQDEYGYYNLI